MTEESVNNNDVNTSGSEEQQQEQQQAPAVTQDDLAALMEKLDKQEKLIDKLREHEKQSLEAEKKAKAEKQTAEERIREEFAQKFDQLAVDAAIERELVAAKAKDVELVKKLIDTSGINVYDGKADAASVNQIIGALKETSGYLFGEESTTTKKQAPKAGRPAEAEAEDVVQKAIRNAKSQQELKEILRKYEVKAFR